MRGPVLALDLARRSGWAVAEPGSRPAFGTVDLRGGVEGEVYAALSNWLADARAVHGFQTIVIEAPLDGRQQKSAAAARLLLGLCAVVHLYAWDHDLAIFEEHVQTTRKAVLGRGTFAAGTAKDEVLRALQARGYRVTDHNAADALVLWLHAEAVALKRPGGALFGRAA